MLVAEKGWSISECKKFRVRRMRIVMTLCLMDVSAPILNLLQVFGFSLLQFFNVIQVFVFFSIVSLSQSLGRRGFTLVLVLILMVVISLLKMFSLTGSINHNFDFSSVGPYFYSLVMPFAIVISILSQKENNAELIKRDLYWFAKWYLIIAGSVVTIYAIAHFSGKFDYFGFGVNFHYFAPFFFYRNSFVLGMLFLILLSGKRAVLLNFLVQYGVYFGGRLRKYPISGVAFIFSVVAASVVLYWLLGEYVSILFRRFSLMYEAVSQSNLNDGILGLANSREAIILFGGRLEEVVGVLQYFSEHPLTVWFGSPPGANYIWVVEQSGYEGIKSFTHFTWLGYVFRYGLIPTTVLISYFIYIGFSEANHNNALWLVFVGILSSATFGANLFYSPTAWVMIALFIRFGPIINRSH